MTSPHSVIRHLLSVNHISFLQESNFASSHALDKFRFLCQAEFDCHVFTNDSGVHEREQVAAKHGGLCIVLHTDIKGAAAAQHLRQLDIADRYMVLHLCWEGRDVYLHNVYAPAKQHLQQAFFENLPRSFASDALHIVGGDFNTVLDPSVDSTSCHSTQIAGIEALNGWLCALNVVDPWRIHHGDTRVYSSPKRKNRLDYILISPELNDLYYRDSRYSTRTYGGDHLPVHLQLESSSAIQRRGPWRVRATTLAQESVKDWLIEEMDLLLSSIEPTRNPGIVYQTWKRRIRCALITKQQNDFHVTARAVTDAERELASCRELGTECSPERLTAAETQHTQAAQQHHQFLKAEAFYRQFHDTECSSSFFFRPTTTTLSRCPIDRIESMDGEVITSQTRVQQAHQEFWGSVFGDASYASQADLEIDATAQDRLLNTISKKLSAEAQEMLDRPISEDELVNAIRDLPKSKAPGYDGLTSEFFQVDAPRMARILKLVFDHQLTRGVLLPDQRVSIVALLHKGKSRAVPAHYRPISLLPVDVKILSRVLTSRLRSVMSTLIHSDQRGFIQGRHISHSLLLMYDLQEHVTASGGTAYATFVDAEKAFDRVNWDYMWKVLKTMGFGDTFVSWCQLLYADTRVRLNINGWLQDCIHPRRGVKQGDPLSALLFVLTMEPLANLLRQHPEYGYHPAGLPTAVTGSYFADDTALVSCSATAVEKQLELVQVYCAGSGAKLNVAKTSVMSLNRHAPRVTHPTLSILDPSASCRYLGLPIGQGIHHDHRVSVINGRFFEQLARWKWRARTLRGRRLLAQAVILSQLWYATAVTFVPNAIVRAWQRAIDMFVLRSATGATSGRRPIDARWLYHRDTSHTLRLPHVHTILKRQRLKLLTQIVQDADSTHSFTWSTLSRHYLDTVCGAFGRPGRHDYLWVNPNSKLARQALMVLPVWHRAIIRTWYGAKFAIDISTLSNAEQARLLLEAPLWMNRFHQWQVQHNEQTRSLLPAPSHRRFTFLRQVVCCSGIRCLSDVYTASGWPSQDVFLQRVMVDFASAGESPPRRSSILQLYLQLTAVNARLPRGVDCAQLGNAVIWPWVIRSPTSTKRFPVLPPKLVYRDALPQSTPTSPHPLLRHELVAPAQLTHLLHHTARLRPYVSPVQYDVRFRVWWFILPAADKYGVASYRQDRYCQHGCRHIENYKHLFFDCRVARPLWRVHANAWKPILLGAPGWKEALFGANLSLRRPYRPSSRAVSVLWNIVCSVVFHTLWTARNDKKHRSIDAPPTSVLIQRDIGLVNDHIKAIKRTAADPEDDQGLTRQLSELASTLKLSSA